MTTKGELQGLHITELASRCGKTADNISVDEDLRDAARSLKDQWVMLVQQQTPPPGYFEQKTLDSLEAALKTRMIDFLIMF
jgi:hypothetical protein